MDATTFKNVNGQNDYREYAVPAAHAGTIAERLRAIRNTLDGASRDMHMAGNACVYVTCRNAKRMDAYDAAIRDMVSQYAAPVVPTPVRPTFATAPASRSWSVPADHAGYITERTRRVLVGRRDGGTDTIEWFGGTITVTSHDAARMDAAAAMIADLVERIDAERDGGTITRDVPVDPAYAGAVLMRLDDVVHFFKVSASADVIERTETGVRITATPARVDWYMDGIRIMVDDMSK